MLARLVRELPEGNYLYEPKWDGFRALAFRDGDAVAILSRHERPIARYFPELVEAVRGLAAPQVVLDGEIVIMRNGRFDFERLMLRTHPAPSRIARLSEEAPATYIAFDLLSESGEDLRQVSFGQRRQRLERLLREAPAGIRLTPATTDRALAVEWLRRFTGNGVDGVVAKHRGLTYQPGKRAMLKVKVERTADCVVGGFRDFPDGAVASLLLGLYDDTGMLRHVGVCAAFAERERWKLAEMMRPLVRTLEGHPWQRGFGLERSPVGRLQGAAGRWDPTMELDWTPIALLVAEVAYDTLDDQRLRHPARFRRWRPDRDPASCTFDQLPDEAPNLQMLLSAVVAES